MSPREIIAEAWAITIREPLLRRWQFTSSLLETLLSVKLIGYQLYFGYNYFFLGEAPGFFDVELLIIKAWPIWLSSTVIGLFILLVLTEFFLPHLCLGAIIGLGAKAHRKEPVKGGLVLGLYNFFPIFTIHEFLTLSSISTFITASSLTLRYVEGPLGRFSIIVMAILFVFSLLLKFLFAFAQESVVIQKMGIFQAIGRSFKLIVSHLGHIVFLLLLLFVISIRILINAMMIVLVPGVIIGLALILTTILPHSVSYGISGIVGLVLIVAASYFFAYLDAFKQTVWTITYMELSKEKDLDVIVHAGENI